MGISIEFEMVFVFLLSSVVVFHNTFQILCGPVSVVLYIGMERWIRLTSYPEIFLSMLNSSPVCHCPGAGTSTKSSNSFLVSAEDQNRKEVGLWSSRASLALWPLLVPPRLRSPNKFLHLH